MSIDQESERYIESKQRFVKFLADGDTKDLYYIGHLIGPAPEKFLKKDKDGKPIPENTIHYTFRTKLGFTQTWTQGDPRTLSDFLKIPKGSLVSLTKVQKGKYLVRKIDGPAMPKSADGSNDETVPF